MALSDTITSLGTSIINLVGTRAKKDMSNLTTAGENVIKGLASGVPTGTVIAYMGTTAPDGFLLMDGREVSKTTYADLYAVVGDSMGTATDSSKFVIADMTDGRYLMGSTVAGSSEGTIPCKGNGKTLGMYSGSKTCGPLQGGDDYVYSTAYYNQSLPYNKANTVASNYRLSLGTGLGITTSAEESGIVADLDGQILGEVSSMQPTSFIIKT